MNWKQIQQFLQNIYFNAFLGEIDIDLKKIQHYLLSKQNKDGGWPLLMASQT